MIDSRNALLTDDPRYALGGPDNALAPQPTWADAASWHGQNLADTWQAMQDPQMWQQAAQQYGNALLMGTTAPGSPSLAGVMDAWDALGISHHISENNGVITLSKVVVPAEARNQGVGTQAMQHLTDYADATGQRIVLSPSKDFGATSISRLKDFYRDAGFKPNTGRSRDLSISETMIRDPQLASGQ